MSVIRIIDEVACALAAHIINQIIAGLTHTGLANRIVVLVWPAWDQNASVVHKRVVLLASADSVIGIIVCVGWAA